MEADALDVGQRLRSSILQERYHGAHTVEEKCILSVEDGVSFTSDLLAGAEESWAQIGVVIGVPSVDGLVEVRCARTVLTRLVLGIEL